MRLFILISNRTMLLLQVKTQSPLPSIDEPVPSKDPAKSDTTPAVTDKVFAKERAQKEAGKSAPICSPPPHMLAPPTTTDTTTVTPTTVAPTTTSAPCSAITTKHIEKYSDHHSELPRGAFPPIATPMPSASSVQEPHGGGGGDGDGGAPVLLSAAFKPTPFQQVGLLW